MVDDVVAGLFSGTYLVLEAVIDEQGLKEPFHLANKGARCGRTSFTTSPKEEHDHTALHCTETDLAMPFIEAIGRRQPRDQLAPIVRGVAGPRMVQYH